MMNMNTSVGRLNALSFVSRPQVDDEKKTSVTLTGREFEKDPLQTASGW